MAKRDDCHCDELLKALEDLVERYRGDAGDKTFQDCAELERAEALVDSIKTES